MGRKKARTTREQGAGGPRRGKRRSIRFDAVEDEPGTDGRVRDPDKPLEILLRKLTVDEALGRLAAQVRAAANQGRDRVLVVHGKGGNSPGGIGVLGPAVRQWCDAHPGLVSSWQEAPSRWGGAGAVVIRLR